MGSLSTDITLPTIGGDEKFACRAGEVLIAEPDGEQRKYGRFSWLLGQALLRTTNTSNWITVMAEMARLAAEQNWEQPLLFCGQPTQRL